MKRCGPGLERTPNGLPHFLLLHRVSLTGQNTGTVEEGKGLWARRSRCQSWWAVSGAESRITGLELGADDYGMKKYVMAFLREGKNKNLDSVD